MKSHCQSSEEQNFISFQDSRVWHWVWQNVFHMKVKSWTWVQSIIFWNFQVHSTPMSSRMLLMGRITQRGTYRSTKNFLVPLSRQSKTSLCSTSSEVHSTGRVEGEELADQEGTWEVDFHNEDSCSESDCQYHGGQVQIGRSHKTVMKWSWDQEAFHGAFESKQLQDLALKIIPPQSWMPEALLYFGHWINQHL